MGVETWSGPSAPIGTVPSLSPFVTLAKLRLPQQDMGGEDNVEKVDATR
jgi:hypothetical protein